ncbi:MAG: hypothetical protein K6A64_01785 [Bacteroidales bacterium]|nr:hypothetical protein [Bacteroidales bacterium]
MDSPFIYNAPVTGKNFIGRRQDSIILQNLLSQGEHVAIWEPPKTGISSLIRYALFNMSIGAKPSITVEVSLMNVRTLEEFLVKVGSALIRSIAATPMEYSEVVDRFLRGTHLVFDEKQYSSRDEVLSLNWTPDDNDIRALLVLPFKISESRNQKLFLILNEFQNVSFTEDPDRILRPLDEVLRSPHGRDCSFIFTGSMVNAMQSIFVGSRLFHRVVTRVKLSEVDDRDITDHINKGFLSSGKVVTNKDQLQGACRLLRCNLWYFNQFASFCDAMSKGYIMEPAMVDALSCLIALHEPRFTAIMNSLTTHQVNLLRAIKDGITHFSTAEVIRKYSLNSSANVNRVKEALMKKEVITFVDSDTPLILDPLFEYWLKTFYFENK